MSKQSDALRDFFDKNGILQKQVCEALGLTPATISNILAGRYQISKKVARQLAETYGLSMVFLITGEGQLVPPASIRIHQSNNTNTGDGAGAIHVDASLQAENAQLRAALERERTEKERLLGIIETLTTK